MGRSIWQRRHVPALAIHPAAVVRDGFPMAVGFTPRSRRDPRALPQGARMEFFPVYLRRSSVGRERGTVRFRQYVDLARGDTAHRVQEVLLTPAGGPTFVLLRCSVRESATSDRRRGGISFVAAPEPSTGRSRWARLDRGDEVAFDLRFPYEAGPDDRVAVVGISPGELSQPGAVLDGLGELSGWRLTRFDERLVHGSYWHRLASGALAPHSGSLRREVDVAGLGDPALWELGVSLGLPLERGRRYDRAALEERLRALHGTVQPLPGSGDHTASYHFVAGRHEKLWAVYGLFAIYGLEAPHLRRVLELVEQRRVGGRCLADAGYRFELACPEVPSLFGGAARLPALEGGEALTAEAVVEPTRREVFGGRSATPPGAFSALTSPC